jgi:signal transduction histidine kinase
MIVLVLEEIRYKNEQTLAEIAFGRSEKEALQSKILTAEEECRSLYDKVRVTEGIQKAYDELRQTQQLVVQQERLRALGQMASGVAHDINNALSPIVAYSELLQVVQPDLTETSKQYLHIIKQAGDDIAHIVARMREFYRRRSCTEPLVEVDVNRLISEVIELTRPRWRDIPQREGISIGVTHDLESGLPPLLCDPSELREALINLFFNSVDALPRGGVITLASRSVAPEGNADASRMLQIEVKDDGEGMDEKTRQRCLEPFFSTKSLEGRTGLGLSMVYGMIQRHEGTIDIISTPGQGALMRLTFPIRKKAPSAIQATQGPSLPKPSLRVLCVDDEEPIRLLLNDCLTQYNHRVQTAAGAEQGLEYFRTALVQQQPFDAIITDLGMPKMDGHQLARTIKAESPQTPVIMMTGWGAMMKEDGDPSPEVDALVGKPPHLDELNNLLIRLANKQ